MTLLNKGLRLTPDQTQIQLNNRLFETSTGTLFVTLKPDAPTVSPGMSTYTVNLLDPGSATAGYLKIAVKHLDILQATAGYSFVVTTLGNAPQTIETPKIGYDEEVTLGLSWNATNGQISYAIARADSLFNNSPTNPLNAFTTGVNPTVSGFAITNPPTTTDTFTAINDGQYAGFLNKVATYSTVMSNADLQRYALDPVNLPTANRVLMLDATALNAANRFDASVAEVQSITFGPAAASGVITVDGATTVVMAGDSAATVAEKVRASLADSTRFKPQLEKQKITFSANTAGTTFNVAGVAVTVTAPDTAISIAGKVKAALDANAFITGNAGRSIQNNGDGSLTVTFNSSDNDARSIAVDSLATTIKASVDTVQTYSATGTGRKVSVSGSTLSIELNPADLNPLDLTVSTGTTGVALTRPGAVASHTQESRSFVPSSFAFVGTPVGEVQRFLVTTGADADGGTFTVAPSSGTAFTAGTATFAAGAASPRTIAETVSAIATALKTANTSNANVADVVAVGDAVEIRYKAIAGNVAPVAVLDSGTGTLGIVQTTQQYAQNLQGEAQTITFLTNPNGTKDIFVDKVTVPVVSTDTASSIATKVQTALVKQGTGDPEIQTITFTGPVTTAGNITVANTTVAVALSDTDAQVAAKVVAALNLVAAKNYTATQDTASVRVTFDASAGDVPLLGGLTLPGAGAAAGVAAAGGFSTTQENNVGRYSAPEVQMITFLSTASGAGNINVNGVSVAVLQNDAPAVIAGKVVAALNGVANKNYTAAQDGDSVRVTFHNAAGDAQPMSGLTLPGTGAAAGVTATSFSTIQEYNANGIRTTKVNSDGTLTIEFAAYEGNVDPVAFNGGVVGVGTGVSAVTASVATTREANSVLATTSAYSGSATNVGSGAAASNVIYTQLVSTDSGTASKASKKVVFDVFVDQAALSRSSQIGTGYESVDFTLGYSTTEFSPATLNVELTPSTGGSPIFNASKAGEIVVRWLDTQSITNFTKPIARVTLNQVQSGGSFKDAVDLSLSNVSIDGVDFTDGTTYARSFVDTLSTDRWDVKQKLVNGLDGTTPIGGQMVGFYGAPSVTGRQLELKFNAMKDSGGTNPTLSNSKQVVLDVVNTDFAGVRTIKFAIELPSNAATTTFALSAAATTAGLKLATGAGVVNGVVGRTLFVTLDGGNATGLARGATIGSLTTDLSNARDVTHEFGFVNGSISYTNANTSGTGAGKSIYVGYTATANDNSVLGLSKGDWIAKDMPRGEFNKFLIDTAPTNASRAITAADALQILKLSAGYDLDWRTAGSATPIGAFAAADMDGSGKVTSNDALIALRYATGIIPATDPVKWRFYDSATAELSVERTQLQALKTGMTVVNTSDILEITATNGQKDFFTQAILVGNLTNPALEV
jgi:hypothetical protein